MHPLNGPRAKVKRAKGQLITLQTAFQMLFKRYPYSVIVDKFDRKAGHYPLRIIGGPPALPDEWSVMIGEIAHNLRSALDLLVWQLALLSTPEPYRDTAFPIFSIGHTKRRRNGDFVPHFWGKRYGRRYLKSIDRRFWTRIEVFQPYKRENKRRQSPLFLLHELNNTDKHRLITVLVTTVGGMEFTGLVGGGSKFKVGVPIHENAKVGYVRPLPGNGAYVLDVSNGRPKIKLQKEVQVNLDITPGIRFGDGCDAIKYLPVIRTLKRIVDEVSRVIESFAGEF